MVLAAAKLVVAEGFLYNPFPVKVILNNRLAPVATIHHMINRAGVFDAQLPGHDPFLNLTTGSRQDQD